MDAENRVQRISFSEIESFFFEPETLCLYLCKDNKYLNLVTPTRKDHKINGGYENLTLNTSTFENATIDHNPSFKDFIRDNKSSLHVLFDISQIVHSKRWSKNSEANREKIKKYIIEKDLLEKLWAELTFIAENQSLEIVHSKYNLKNY